MLRRDQIGMSEPISLFFPTALIAVAAVPLALSFVPPNPFYGVRTALTLADRDLWFHVNRFAGWVFLAAAALTTGVFTAMPELASGRSFSGLLVLIGPMAAAVAAVATYCRRLARG
jgi:uncharacterized membrane protein